tara:strand:+ start:7507 stop:9897 length:2391 start_codon:yes stop_codon:yes gene_type:complete
MGCLVKSSLSALSSVEASICPTDLTLDQYSQTYNGEFVINFVNALSGIQDFKNLNFTNFYLTDNVLLDDITSHKEIKVKPESYFTTLNFTTSANNYLLYRPASLSSFKNTNRIYDADYYGVTTFTPVLSDASNFEITFIDDFTCRVSTISSSNNIRYYLVVSDDEEVDGKRNTLFVGENQLPENGFNLEYNLLKYKTDSFINLYSTKEDIKYILLNNDGVVKANKITTSDGVNQFFIADSSIKINQELNLSVPSPYNASFVTYSNDGKVDNDKSDFNLPSNYLFYSSSNKAGLDFNFYNLKNIVNTQEQFNSSNNLLSTSNTTIYSQDLRTYTSIFSDIDSERNETLSLNFVYNNYDILIKPGTTFFTTPSSMAPFDRLNINDTKFTKCGSFSFKRPDLSDRVYRLDDDSVKEENVTYLCTWLSGGIGQEGIWVDRYYYPDLVDKETALAASPAYNTTYKLAVENLIASNSTLKSSIEKKLYLDKKSDLVFEPNKRYKYVRISEDDFIKKSPTNFCDTAQINGKVNNYFNTINDNGGFGLGFTLQNDAGDFSIKSGSNDINGGISFEKFDDEITFKFALFDNSTSGASIEERLLLNTFIHKFKIDKFEKTNIFLSFNAIQGVCNLYLNSNVIFTFEVGAYQLYTKRILFGDIFLHWDREVEEGVIDKSDTDTINKREILYNEATSQDYIYDVYLALDPLEKYQELAVIFSTNIDSIQDLTISLPCGMRNLTDTINTVNSINTNLKSKSAVVDINIKNLNINDDNINNEVRDIIKSNIVNSLPKSTVINNINIVNYK